MLLYYLPIYFQAIDAVSPQESGVRNLPLIIAICELLPAQVLFGLTLRHLAIGTVASGGLVSAFGHYIPLLLVGGTLATVGMGLIYTLQIGSKSSHWIGFQVLTGLGVGFGFQIPQIVAQSVCELSEVSHYMAITLCKPPASFIKSLLTIISLPNDRWNVLHFRRRVNFCK